MGAARALIGLLVASILASSVIASPAVEDNLDEVVPEMVEAHELIQAPPVPASAAAAAKKSKVPKKRGNSKKVATKKKKAAKKTLKVKAKLRPPSSRHPVAMTCLQRKQAALSTLMNYNAAKTLRDASEAFSVEDTASKWRINEWHKRYVTAAAEYAFFCEQSQSAVTKITATVRRQEANEAKKAALKGLQQATQRREERRVKFHSERRKKKADHDTKAKEDKQKKLIQETAQKARLVRLRSYPQDSLDFEGFVADAETGQGVGSALVEVKCPFKTYTGRSGEGGKTTFAKYLIRHAVTGPDGYRCYATFSKRGYIPLKYDLVIGKHDTPALFRTAMLLPQRHSAHVPFRVVMQYGNQPADIDAHLFVMQASPTTHKPVNVGEHFDGSAAFSYDPKGSASSFPFMTLDAKCNTGYGPETHTIHKTLPVKYGFYIKNYDHHITNNAVFHNSEARVFLYQGTKLTHSFAIRNAQGTPSSYWQVFSIDCTANKGASCNVLPIDAFVAEQPTSPILATKH